ncbi:MAG: hypothetical protein GXY55_06590 [Phycisphaerae bacterium]|nr:hypothetical protein [Phycisphaerae bacterium]
MQNLTRASEELFRRSPDERFGSLTELWQFCQNEKQHAAEHWPAPQSVRPNCQPGTVVLGFDMDREFYLNDWSFSQLCRLAGVSKDTLNRLSPETASRALQETMPTERPEGPFNQHDGWREIIEFGRTPEGRWYPTRVRSGSAVVVDGRRSVYDPIETRIVIDFSVSVPDDFFAAPAAPAE